MFDFHSKLTAQQLQRRSRLAAVTAIVNNWEATQHADAKILTTAIHWHFWVNSRHSYPSTQWRTSLERPEPRLWHEQRRTTFPNSQWYGKSNDTLISNLVTDCFDPKVGTFPHYQWCIFVSNAIVRCGVDQFGTYRWHIFVGPSCIPVIGDYLYFFVTSDIADIRLFS
jgi:hypothetical protein